MHAKPFRHTAVAILSLFALTYLSAAVAEDDDQDDPPDRVARLSYLQGDVSLQPGGSDDWTQASQNRPLTVGDKLFVDKSSRAELQVGNATLHVDQGTGFSILDLSDDVVQIQLTDGALHFKIDRLRDGEVVEVDTPNAAVTLDRPGDYHVEAKPEGDATFVKVYAGEAQVRGGGDTTELRSREQAEFAGTDRLQVNRGRADERSDFDAWANDRNNRFAKSTSAQYVDPEVIGYQDLDDNGSWESEPAYGQVWVPTRVVAGWAPYRYGHWIWVAPWGWTWVDDAPWGFAPFHYGRWAYSRSRWVWVPGPRHIRPVYAPALVGWVGSPNVSVSVSVGVGWFPLAPREVFVPAYRCGPRHIERINVSNTVIVNRTYITNVYQNRVTNIRYANRGRAVTVVQRDTFVSARPVGTRMVQVRDVNNWRVEHRAPAIAPERVSTLGPRWSPDRNHAPANFRDRTVVVNHAPPPARASFTAERQAIVANGGRPAAREAIFQNRSQPRPDVRRFNGGPAQNPAASNAPPQIPSGRPTDRRNDDGRNDRSNDGRSDRPNNAREPANDRGVDKRDHRNLGSATKNEMEQRGSAPQAPTATPQRNPGEAPRPTNRPRNFDRPPNARMQRDERDHVQQSPMNPSQENERIQSMRANPPSATQQENRPQPTPNVQRQPDRRGFEEHRNQQPSTPKLEPAPQAHQNPPPRVEQPRPQPQPRVEQPRPQPQPRAEQPRSQPEKAQRNNRGNEKRDND